MKYWITILCATLLLTLNYFQEESYQEKRNLNGLSTGEVLVLLGDSVIQQHLPDTSVEKFNSELGEQLVKGNPSINGNSTKAQRISAYFECTSCHTLQAETAELTNTDPEHRLAFAAENDLPYLQGSTMFGLVSRLHYYNGDYQKKYGDLAKKAYSDIREAIQLCASECAQGRRLKSWELESVLSYFWTLDIPFSELELNENELDSIQSGLQYPAFAASARKIIYSKYVTAYPATFLDPPKDRKTGNPFTGDPINGKLIYTHSCLHCHKDQRYSLYELDTSYMSLNQLARRMPTYHEESVYQVARYGTQPLFGKGAYMPNYTQEKLSRKQMADLRAYIFSKMD